MEFDFSLAADKLQRMSDGAIAALPNLILMLVLVAVFYFIARGARTSTMQVFRRTGRSRYAAVVMGRLVQWVVVIVGIVVGFSVLFPSLSAADTVGLLGIGGIAIGFAFRDIAQNFLAGILLLATQPFRLGDQIMVDEYEGTVEDIQTRATIIKTYDGRHVVVPNSHLFTESVTVNTAESIRRSEYDVGIHYDDDIDLAKRLMLEAMMSIEDVLNDPAPDVLTVELAESSVNIRARWWTKSRRREVVMVQDKVITEIKKNFDRHGITIPFPIRTLDVPYDSPVINGRFRQGG